MYRRGIVEEVDAATHRARVKFPERQDLVSGWLDVLAHWSHGNKGYSLPDVGDQVAVMLDERDEAGCVLGGVYSSADPVPTGASADKRIAEFSDGFRCEYDRVAHVLKVIAPGGAMLELAGNASALALATKVADELGAIKDELANHTHQAGLLVAPPGTAGGPVTGTTGAAVAIAYEPSDTGAAQVKSA